MISLPYSEKLNIGNLSRIFANTSECYKFFWFRAIIDLTVKGGRDTVSFDELVNKMIADAWYMVTEYHLNLGPNDTLEKAILYLKEISGLKSCTKEKELLSYFETCADPRFMSMKRTLVNEVPFRLQAPFMPDMRANEWNTGTRKRAEQINAHKHLLYYFYDVNGLDTQIRINGEWQEYLKKNYEIISGWMQFDLVIYLQKRNPSVPGISDKLSAPQTRKLEDIKRFYKIVMSIEPVHDIYSDEILSPDDISIDHFVPWSYVANDEFWDLSPTTKSINSSKSNNLPDWNRYFGALCRQEYRSYRMIRTSDRIHDEFEKLAKEHLNNAEIKHRLYDGDISGDEFSNRLKDVIYPVYQSAKNSGFENWVYRQ